MRTPAAIGRHPIHPMLVTLPIGLWIFSLVSDLIYKAGWGGESWHGVAFYTMAGGLVGALVAAVPGFMDFRSIHHPKTKAVGTWHMVINLAAVVLFSVNLWLRTSTTPEDNMPVWLSAFGVALIGISGWLGGELVYHRKVGVDEGPSEQGLGQKGPVNRPAS